jgi:hypothetical protein
VTKSIPVALLRTCHFIHDEAQSFIESRLKDESSRYIFEAKSILVFLDPGSLELFRKIMVHERFFARSKTTGEVPSLENAVLLIPKWNSWSKKNVRESELGSFFNNPDEYASFQRFVLRCARWNVLAKSHRSASVRTWKRYKDVIIGVKLPPGRPSYVPSDWIDQETFCLHHNYRMMNLVVQPGHGDDQQLFARLHEEIQQYIDEGRLRYCGQSVTRRYGSSRNRPHRMEQPTAEEWARDWEEDDVS